MSFYEHFLQSEGWQQLQAKNEKHCLRVQGALFVVETLPVIGRYFYTPRWPASSISNFKFQISKMKEDLIKLAQTNQAGWVRVEPENEETLKELKSVFGASRVLPAPHDVQPREILVWDITRPEDELLTSMKSKTRYNVRLAEKHGVTVRFTRSKEDLEQFINLIYATTERKAIRPHPKNYYRNFFAIFPETECTLAVAEYEGQVLAANLLVFHGGTAYYLHGGSSDKGRHLMAPYLLQWRSIEEAKLRGCTLYDFGGVNTQATSDKRQATSSDWSGITRFKQGFAPNTPTLTFPGAYDIVISLSQYRLYRLLQKLQMIKKRLF